LHFSIADLISGVNFTIEIYDKFNSTISSTGPVYFIASCT